MKPVRTLLLRMSQSDKWARRIKSTRVTRRVVARFVPGENLADGLDAIREVNTKGMSASLNPLGEHVTTEAEAAAAADEYIRILDGIAAEELDSNLSVKLSLIGLDIAPAIAQANLRRVLKSAREHGNFVRIDMEGSETVDDTLRIFEELRTEFPETGVVSQSYLRRAGNDIDRLVSMGASIRIVKGAYNEPPEVAFPNKQDVDQNFGDILDCLAGPDARAAGVRVAVATHDKQLLNHGLRLILEHGLGVDWEFQMLYGIRRDLQAQLVDEGQNVRIYISYGPAWYPWFMRRLAERPSNLWFFLSNLLR